MENDIYCCNTPLTNCKDFIDYWNAWHKEWFAKTSCWISTKKVPTALDNILGWAIPDTPVWQDFPEPYWGNPCNPKAVFININPAGSGENKDGKINDLRLPVNPANTLYNEYFRNGNYFDTITSLGSGVRGIYTSAVVWHNKRAKWASDILGITPLLKINDILDLDLVPWHTKTAAQINKYIKKPCVCTLIMNKILIPAICISNSIPTTSCFNNNIIGRGKPIQDILSLSCFRGIIIPPPPPIYYNTINRRNRWQFNSLLYLGIAAKCKIYIGGYGGMNLPLITDNFTDGTTYTTKQIVCL